MHIQNSSAAPGDTGLQGESADSQLKRRSSPPRLEELGHENFGAEVALQILYVAFGYRYVVQAINSACSARRAGTLCNIKLVTNLPIKRLHIDGEVPFDEIVVVQAENKDNRYTKIRIIDFADGPASLYLDCDTEVRYPLHKFVPVLAKFDVALRVKPYASHGEFELIDERSPAAIGISALTHRRHLFCEDRRGKGTVWLVGTLLPEDGFSKRSAILFQSVC